MKAVAHCSRYVKRSVETSDTMRAQSHEEPLKRMPYARTETDRFTIHFGHCAQNQVDYGKELVALVAAQRNKVVPKRTGWKCCYAKGRKVNERDSLCAAVIGKRIDRIIMWSAPDDLTNVSARRTLQFNR